MLDYRLYNLGRLNLPNVGHQAIITVNACYGWNINNDGLANVRYYSITNYQMTAHIYSTIPWNSRAIFPKSLGSTRSRYTDPNYSIYSNGFVVVTSPFVRPPGFYLTPIPSNPKNQVEVWMHSPPWHARPLVQVVQSEGSFTKSFDERAATPRDGYMKLDMFVNTLTQIYKNPSHENRWF